SGLATFIAGANRFMGSADQLRSTNNRDSGATLVNYDLQLVLETSFSGRDLLSTVLRAGNFGASSVFGSGGPSALSVLETAYQADGGANVLAIDKLFYSFPIGDSITITSGPLVGQEDMLAVWPSAYSSDPILDVLTLNGAPGAYNKNLGAGAGISWSDSSGMRASANYVAANGATSDSSQGGIATDAAGGTGTVQLGWEAEGWNVAAIYSQIQNGHDLIAYATPFTQQNLSGNGVTHAFGLGGSWATEESGWVPAVSVGWGFNSSDTVSSGEVSSSQSWTVGLEWNDVLLAGNNAGMAVGQPVFATDLRGGDTPADGQFLWEWWYQFQVTDNISVTPAVFYLSRPMGGLTPAYSTFQQLGGLMKTTFVF
uniref:carbohydrate porin n=1 Tax=Synechococcus sp. N5 TaxID=2575515 RepID=UPI000E0FC666